MARKIISPITRINGFWRIDVDIEDQEVVDAKSGGVFFRGIEEILLQRDPRDAPYLTSRICGICSTAHSLVASLALEDALGIEPPRNGVLLRNITFGADLLQNHLRHFYLLSLPDFAPGPRRAPFVPCYDTDYRLDSGTSDKLYDNYAKAMHMSRKAHDMVTIYGGKIPHNHGILAGGGTVPPTGDNIRMFLALLEEVQKFIDDEMIPDAHTVAGAYSDYFEIGKGYGNLMTWGMFPHPDKKGEFFFPPKVMIGGTPGDLDVGAISEDVTHSWYEDAPPLHPEDGLTEPRAKKPDAYSWAKAPRYKGHPVEGGPLARLTASGYYRGGVSAMDRILARVLEAQLICRQMKEWVLDLQEGKPIFTPFELPQEAQGVGMMEAMRGCLGHWVKIVHQRVCHYQIITPSAWNCSPRDGQGQLGPIEKALIGTPVRDFDQPIEVGRVARSFDPCIACAVHMVDAQGREGTLEIL